MGPIKELEKFEVKRFGLVIGESAVGKSTLAKAIYLFKDLKNQISNYFINIARTKDELITFNVFHDWLKSDIETTFYRIYCTPLKNCPELYLEYTWDTGLTISIQVKNNRKFYIDDSNFAPEIYSQVQKIYSSVFKKEIKIDSEFDYRFDIYCDFISEAINNKFGDSQSIYYIPANRSAIIDFPHTLSSEGIKSEYFSGRYFSQIYRIKNFFEGGIEAASQRNGFPVGIENIIRDILGGEYIRNNEFDFFALSNSDIKIPLSVLSSGQKEIIWLLYQIYYLLSWQIDAYVIIEEPESHIFTSLQKKVIDVIAFFANKKGNGVFITTHSPYILLAANTLYYAGHFTGEAAAKAEEIVGKGRAIRPNDLNAIQLLHNGSRDLIDTDEHELLTGYIDAADEIHENYDKLIDLESFDDTR